MTSRNTGTKPKTDYFGLMRTSEPLESYGIKEFHKRMEAGRKKKKAQKSGNKT